MNFRIPTLLIAMIAIGVPAWGQTAPVAEAGGPYLVATDGSVALNGNGTAERQKLAEIGLAIANYHDIYNKLPPRTIDDGGGTPLLSWRVDLLQLIDPALHAQFDMTKAWDDPANLVLLQQMPDVYRGPLDASDSTTTRFAGVSGAGTVFPGTGTVKYNNITDGTSNTVTVGEAAGAGIPWTKPEDVDVTLHPTLGDPAGFSSDVDGFVPFVFADGSVSFLPVTTPAATLADLFTINDGNFIDPFPGQSLAFDLAWDLDDNGSFETPGDSPVFDATGLPSPSTVTVTLRATNTLGESTTDTATIVIVAAVPLIGGHGLAALAALLAVGLLLTVRQRQI